MSEIKLPCEIVEDLLPSYVDRLTNELTTKAVSRHLEGCRSCTSKYKAMTDPDYHEETDNDQNAEIDFLKKTRKRHRRRVLFAVLAAIPLALLYWIYASFNGSIFQKIRYTKLANEYIKTHYANENFIVEKAQYDFKVNGYYCRVYDPKSQDVSFHVYPYQGDGELADDYDNMVNKLWNTNRRMSIALDKATEELFADFPYRQRLMMTEFTHEDVTDKFYLNMPFELYNLPDTIKFNVWIETQKEVPSWEEVEERLVEIKHYVESKGLTMESYSLSLEYPYIEKNGEIDPIDYTNGNYIIYDVPSDIIDQPEELHKFVEKARENIEAELKEIADGTYEKEPAVNEAAEN